MREGGSPPLDGGVPVSVTTVSSCYVGLLASVCFSFMYSNPKFSPEHLLRTRYSSTCSHVAFKQQQTAVGGGGNGDMFVKGHKFLVLRLINSGSNIQDGDYS